MDTVIANSARKFNGQKNIKKVENRNIIFSFSWIFDINDFHPTSLFRVQTRISKRIITQDCCF